jgi:hypothetical protein
MKEPSTQTTLQQHANRLRRLGFPEKVVQEVERTNRLEPVMKSLTDDELRAKTDELIARLKADRRSVSKDEPAQTTLQRFVQWLRRWWSGDLMEQEFPAEHLLPEEFFIAEYHPGDPGWIEMESHG